MNEQTNTKPSVTLIDYNAPWCGPCRAMEPIFDELKKELAGQVIFEDVNVDTEPEKGNAAGVMSIPTLQILKNGKIVQTLIGYQSKEDLLKHLNAAIG